MSQITTRVEDGRIYATVETEFNGTREYRTNRDLCGLWVWQQSAREWKQIKGTSQFSAKNRASMARKMRAKFLTA